MDGQEKFKMISVHLGEMEYIDWNPEKPIQFAEFLFLIDSLGNMEAS